MRIKPSHNKMHSCQQLKSYLRFLEMASANMNITTVNKPKKRPNNRENGTRGETGRLPTKGSSNNSTILDLGVFVRMLL